MWHSIGTQWTSRLTVCWESTNFWLMHMSWLTLSLISTGSLSSVNWVLISMLIEYQLRCHEGFWSRLSMDNRLQVRLVHMILIFGIYIFNLIINIIFITLKMFKINYLFRAHQIYHWNVGKGHQVKYSWLPGILCQWCSWWYK